MRKYHFPSSIAFILLAVLFAFFSVSCSCSDDDDDSEGSTPADDTTADDTAADDVTDDSDDSADDDTTPPWENLSDPLGTGEVRAGIISAEDELIGGPRARGAIGDIKLYNSKIELIIRSTENPGTGWTGTSGVLIDADRAREPGVEGNDCLWGLEHLVGLLRSFYADEIEIVSDGHDGKVVIRVTGHDGGIDIIDEVVGTGSFHLGFVIEYTLLPDKDYVSIKTTLVNKTERDRDVFVADVPLWGDHTKIFTPRAGYEIGEADLLSMLRFVGGVTRTGLPVSYALATAAPDRSFYIPYIDGDILPVVEGIKPLAPWGEVSWERLFIVGTGGTETIKAAIFEYDGDTNYGTIQGDLDLESGDDQGNVEIIVTNNNRPAGKNYAGVMVPDESGHYSMDVEPGKYTLVAKSAGRADSDPSTVTVAAGETKTANISLDATALFSYDVSDGTQNIPCRLSFRSGFDASINAGIVYRIWSNTGLGTEPVTPGDYTVTASRGYEYEISTQNVHIAAGETAAFDAVIERSVDTTGYMTADFHIHTEFSIDSQALAESRIRELMGEGLELPVITDHDFVSDYDAFKEAIGAEAWINPLRGMEISPVIGHFNAWPLIPPADANDYYGVPLVEYDADRRIVRRYQFPDLFDIVRSEFSAQVIQINHPRDSTGWFDWVEYDPAVGVSSARPSKWSDEFDAIEVFNGGNDDKGTLADWFSFLDQGYSYTMTGNSDSHSPTSMLGNPRNIFKMPTDDPAAADDQDLVDSILGNHSEVSNGPFITFSINGQEIGGFVTGLATDADIDLEIKVQAPTWMPVNYLRVYTNHGTLIDEETITETDVVRFDGTITVSATEDSYFVVSAGHTSQTPAPVFTGELVFAITNPIWVDVDGNSAFDAPGLP